MSNKLTAKIIFYALILAAGFTVGLLYVKSTAPQKPTPSYANENLNLSNNNVSLPPVTQKPQNGNGNANTPAVNRPTPVLNTPPPAPSCIITIDGRRYDVQTLRTTHPGGDVFQCNTDMSDIFHGQHGDNLRMIQKYLVQ